MPCLGPAAKRPPRWLEIIGVDLEFTGTLSYCKVISIGVAGISQRGAWKKLHRLPGIRVPSDHLGPLLARTGPLRAATSSVNYNDFSKSTWKWWTASATMVTTLQSQIDWDHVNFSTYADYLCAVSKVWHTFRQELDTLCMQTHKAGGIIRMVGDNPDVDAWLINTNLSSHIKLGMKYEITVQFVPTEDMWTRPYRSVEATGPYTKMRRAGIIDYTPAELPAPFARHHARVEHAADSDAVDIVCEYAGIVRAYPAVERLGIF